MRRYKRRKNPSDTTGIVVALLIAAAFIGYQVNKERKAARFAASGETFSAEDEARLTKLYNEVRATQVRLGPPDATWVQSIEKTLKLKWKNTPATITDRDRRMGAMVA